MIYITGWRDSHMLPAGFMLQGDAEAEDEAGIKARLDLALVMLESLGYSVEFAGEPGDSEGKHPVEGYCPVDGRGGLDETHSYTRNAGTCMGGEGE